MPLCVAFTAEKLALRLFFWHHACYGWLVRFKFQENDLAAVRALSKRYAEVDRHMPFVASITITPIAKG